MLRTQIILPGGRELFSGADAQVAIQSVTITECVNSAEELTPGSVCANMLETKVLDPSGEFTLHAGEELAVYRVDDGGNRYPVGLFTTEKPTRSSANCISIVAYDRVTWLDKDLTQWLAGLQGWPYTLLTFAGMVCQACGLTLVNGSIPNGEYPIKPFAAEGITGRQLMQWIGQAAGRFCRATVDGKLEFAWYSPSQVEISPAGENAYFMNGLRYETYQVAPVEKVQIRQTGTDVGATYPVDSVGGNTYTVTGNLLLTAESTEQLQTVAQGIYNTLHGITYTPCRVVMPVNPAIHAGDIVQVTDKNGTAFSVYVMTKIQAGQKDTLECTGSPRRDSVTAVNSAKFTALSGKVLEVQMGVEGLNVANRGLEGRLTAAETVISQNTEEIQHRATRSEVTTDITNAVAEANAYAGNAADKALNLANANTQNCITEYQTMVATRFQQTAEDITLAIDKTTEVQTQVNGIRQNGTTKVQTSTGYTFNEEGLKISKSGQAMENIIDNTGMYVKKNGEAMLSANNEGVDAVNLHASTYLIVGGRSRFENFEAGRTGCFWIGG